MHGRKALSDQLVPLLRGENVSLESEISTCPWNAKNYLLRLGIKGLTIPANDLPNSNYVFLIDVSGSMNSPAKLGILKVGFKKPMQTTFGIAFNLSNQYSLLDGVIQSRGFFLQIGKTGDKVSTTIKNASILVEVPFMDFDKKWNEMLFDIVKSKFKKERASKREATIFATQHIKSMREVWNTRRDN